MEKKSLFFIIAAILTLSLVLAGCGGSPAPAEESVGATVSQGQDGKKVNSASDSLADLPAGNVVADLKEIEGTWIAPAYPGNFVLTVFPDGKLSVATSLEDLQRGSTDSWQLTMEGGQITATDYALCPGDVGLYVASLLPDGTLRFTSIIDACDARLRKMDRSLPGRLNEYILMYHPVK